ncbi:MAG: hypothetical protein CL895_10430 [Dehalococcoidia bacterium]|nr:hypothetical protein [Dehalococcoidia bacterium]
MYCRAQLVQLQGDYEEITGLQTDIIAISTDDLSQASYVAESLRLDFPILYDPARMWCGICCLQSLGRWYGHPVHIRARSNGQDSLAAHRQDRL